MKAVLALGLAAGAGVGIGVIGTIVGLYRLADRLAGKGKW